MLDTSTSQIHALSAHLVGNRHHEQPLQFSDATLPLDDERLHELLLRYCFDHFQQPEFFAFDLEGEPASPMYAWAKAVFEDTDNLHERSKEAAQRLYDCSLHPGIKPGELYIALFRDVVVEDELTDAIGLFKSEGRQPFLKLEQTDGQFSLACDEGVNPERLDKGCLIFNLEASAGYKLCILDKSGKSDDARYWRQEFLAAKPCADRYHYTQNVLDATKKFVIRAMPKQFETERADQVDMLNKSVQYFKSNERFEEQSFSEQVFEKEEVAQAFRDFHKDFQEQRNLPPAGEFDLSPEAVKKQARTLKSVLKLDKNFHIYIHGDRELIEKGFDAEKGKNFYKVYFQEEA